MTPATGLGPPLVPAWGTRARQYPGWSFAARCPDG